ncbi:MAG: hypothetical protein JRM80_14660, partial [Nitrososphaerota archaeon]|nr:hypothetical protein [Nitrososphaerota archaeon]
MSDSKAVARVLASGYMLDAKAFEMISSLPPGADEGVVERLLEQKASAMGEARRITVNDVAKLMPREAPRAQERVTVDEPAQVEVLSDPTPAIAPVEGVEGFGKLFHDRYQRLFSIVKERLDTKNSGSVSAA